MESGKASDGAPWTVAWHDSVSALEVQHQAAGDHTRRRVVSNQFRNGAVAWVEREARVLFIEADRPVVGRAFLELPRGMRDPSDDSPLVTARRELWEETGYRSAEAELLGTIWPDTGLLGDGIDIVRIDGATPTQAGDSDFHQPEFETQLWLADDEIDREIAEGRIRDGITLSAIALARAVGQRSVGQ